ncbi:siderophore-interacting protein [Microbacterium sp. C7(2022)]|uniref:siderophore-interacting protein n=1 Tax=Microbacterium sp. C7(2022) TaxID=2992759 RepID=UPI00237B6E2F|nr:siderophore-interacting protein [Microbacterium sp. C7(2022)]MDE0545121.1 siderophore-interacting protein [Microbacterium sp. C7(2022)]
MPALSRLVKPETQGLIHLRVLRTERVSPHFMRVTVGGGEIERFRPMGYDQWFRLFLPLGGDEGLDRLPAKANKMLGYLKYLRIPDGVRPVMRNYSVREYRAQGASGGAEIDIDFVLHGTADEGTATQATVTQGTVQEGPAGPASQWATTCQPGESIVIIDEGLTFNPQRGTESVLLVADETGLPALANICASLPAESSGIALIEVPSEADAVAFAHPSGIDVRYLVRDHETKPGTLALDALRTLPSDDLPPAPIHAWIVGEQSLPTEARRHLVGERGMPKDLVSFCGYWRVGAASPTPKSQQSVAEARA